MVILQLNRRYRYRLSIQVWNCSHRDIVCCRLRGGFPRDEASPSFVALVNDVHRIFLVLRRECECVFGLSIRYFIDSV